MTWYRALPVKQVAACSIFLFVLGSLAPACKATRIESPGEANDAGTVTLSRPADASQAPATKQPSPAFAQMVIPRFGAVWTLTQDILQRLPAAQPSFVAALNEVFRQFDHGRPATWTSHFAPDGSPALVGRFPVDDTRKLLDYFAVLGIKSEEVEDSLWRFPSAFVADSGDWMDASKSRTMLAMANEPTAFPVDSTALIDAFVALDQIPTDQRERWTEMIFERTSLVNATPAKQFSNQLKAARLVRLLEESSSARAQLLRDGDNIAIVTALQPMPTSALAREVAVNETRMSIVDQFAPADAAVVYTTTEWTAFTPEELAVCPEEVRDVMQYALQLAHDSLDPDDRKSSGPPPSVTDTWSDLAVASMCDAEFRTEASAWAVAGERFRFGAALRLPPGSATTAAIDATWDSLSTGHKPLLSRARKTVLKDGALYTGTLYSKTKGVKKKYPVAIMVLPDYVLVTAGPKARQRLGRLQLVRAEAEPRQVASTEIAFYPGRLLAELASLDGRLAGFEGVPPDLVLRFRSAGEGGEYVTRTEFSLELVSVVGRLVAAQRQGRRMLPT